jgi:hypothetical protein
VAIITEMSALNVEAMLEKVVMGEEYSTDHDFVES